MALALSNAFHSPKPRISLRNCNLKTPVSSFQSYNVRFPRSISWNRRVTICAAASAAGSSNQDSELNPYEVLGVSPIEGFDMVKASYTKKCKEAERNNDEATVARLEKAYDKLMMQQLSKRKKGVTFGSIKAWIGACLLNSVIRITLCKVWMGVASARSIFAFLIGITEAPNERNKPYYTPVSKDIKYADKQPIVPWGPRCTKSSDQDVRINFAISAAFTAWIAIKRYAEYKPLQFLAFSFVYRIFEKLKSFEPAVSPTITENGEDDGRALRMGKRILRSLALVFSCITIASLGYTGVLNLMEYVSGSIPAFLYNNQELLVTAASAVMLWIMASYYR